jgi:hypothetical protein
MRMKFHKSLVCGIIAILLLTQTSCMDLAGLRKFTDSSVEAGKKFKALSQDPYRNCAIRVYYQETKDDKFRTIKVFSSPAEYLKTADPTDRQDCERRKERWANLQEANKILMTYLYVMGTLAADDVANTDSQFTTIKGHVSTLSGSDPIFSAAFGIANTITNILLDSKRRKGIKNAILDSNGNVTTVTIKLSEALDGYIIELEREREDLILMYAEALAVKNEFNRELCCQNRADRCKNAEGSDNPNVCVFRFNDALALLSSRSLVETEAQSINAKIKAAKAYQKVLMEIRDGHNELFLEAQRGFNDKQAIKIALKYAPAIQDNFDELVAAF